MKIKFHSDCPFCGTGDEVWQEGSGIIKWIECNRCGSRGPMTLSAKQAWAVWDVRLKNYPLTRSLIAYIKKMKRCDEAKKRV